MFIPPSALADATPEQLHDLAARLQLEVIGIRATPHSSRVKKARADLLERRARDLRRLAEDRRRAAAGPSRESRPGAPLLGPTALAGEGAAPKTTWLSTEQAADRMGIARCTLDTMYKKAPKNLPGCPMHVGVGRRAKHLRWDADRVREWLAAYRDWSAQTRTRGPRQQLPPPRVTHANPLPSTPAPRARVKSPPPGQGAAPQKRRRRSLLAMVTEDSGKQDRG